MTIEAKDVLLAAIAAIPPTIAAVAAFLSIRKTHLAVNSRLSELISSVSTAKFAEGKIAQKKETEAESGPETKA